MYSHNFVIELISGSQTNTYTSEKIKYIDIK